MKYKRIICCALIICTIMMLFCGCNSRQGFDIDYSEKAIKEFLSDVFKNMETGEAEIYDIHSSPGWFLVFIKITLPNKHTERISVNFSLSNYESTEKVDSIGFLISQDNTDDNLSCIIELSRAIEKTLGGKENFIEKTPSVEEIKTMLENEVPNSTTVYKKNDEYLVIIRKGPYTEYPTLTYMIRKQT